MTPKQEIEEALRKAIHTYICQLVVKEYMVEAGDAATVADAPLVIARMKAFYAELR